MDAHQRDFRGQLAFYNEMLFAFACHSSGFLNVIFQQRKTVFVVIESRQSDGNLFVSIAKIFMRHAFVYRDFKFDHFTHAFKLQMDDIFPIVEAAIKCAIALRPTAGGGGRAAELRSPVLARGFVLREE
jgi:hypothetical protein